MTLVKKAMRDALLERVFQEMHKRDDIFFITADFGSPVIDKIKAQFPTKFVNVGIAEQNLINVSCGLALEGFTVYAYAIAPFITMRCYEQIRVNLAILSQVRPMNVNLIGVGAGYSYVVSGPTHQCLEDLSIMRTLPNVELISPSDWVTAAALVDYTLDRVSPKYIRLDAAPMNQIYQSPDKLNFSEGFATHSADSKTCVISTGYMTHKVIDLAKKHSLKINIIDFFNLKNFDEASLVSQLKKHSLVLTIEEGFINKGGMDSLILHLINKYRIQTVFKNLGLDDSYNFELGSRDILHQKNGTGEKQLLEALQS
jgi:transketolase